jgi:hypothetical protein
MQLKKVKKTAICGFAAALSVVLMLFTTVLPVLMYVLPLACGVIVLFVSFIANKRWALSVFFSTAILSFLFLADKETALVYTLFFGYYPLIKESVEKMSRLFSWIIKLGLFNCAAVAIGWLGVAFLGVSGEEYSEFGALTIPVLLAMANLVFFLYDILLKRCVFFIPIVAKKLVKILK